MLRSNIYLIISVFIMISCCFIGCTDVTPTDKTMLYVDFDGTKPYTRIQDAIDNAHDNYTVYVYSGVYHEKLIINKTINLIGENSETTIIEGNNTGNVITVSNCLFCNISGFTIRNSGVNAAGIHLTSGNNNIYNNSIQENYDGILTSDNDLNSFFENTFISNERYGLYLSGSDFNRVEDNMFINNSYGIRVKALDNLIIGNTFEENYRGLYFCCYAEKNLVYHNNFIHNEYYNALDTNKGETWYSEDKHQGNYWGDYSGSDVNNDGIGDTPYNVSQDGSHQDLFPLMNPWGQ